MGRLRNFLPALAGLMLGATLTSAQASTVNGGLLMSSTDADQFETWLGLEEQTFTNIFTGQAGVATAEQFHAAADGVGPTISIYEVTIHDGSTVRIGGYTAVDWGAAGTSGAYFGDPTAFIFNLTTGERQDQRSAPLGRAVLVFEEYFPTFGGGHDIFGGRDILGRCGISTSTLCDGYTYSFDYDRSQGQISIAGDSGAVSGDSGVDFSHIVVQSLEVYTFADAAVIPLPAGAWLLLSALGGMGVLSARRRRASRQGLPRPAL